jgi:RimJ/RimL family protein N-acetyltransferase
MWDVGHPLGRAESDAKLARYRAAFDTHGFGRWAVVDPQGSFLGYAGVMPISRDFPVAPGFEIGWRFVRSAWGKGLATEAAAAALADVFARSDLPEILSYTAADNLRSRAVMRRLGLQRDPRRDFALDSGWRGLVWVAQRGWSPPT